MNKLLSANFARLIKSKVFWVLESVCFLLGAVFYFLVIINTRNLGESWLLRNANFYFFFFVLYVGIIIAIFTSMFLGTEYSDGTLRNKLCVGHRRRDIYFSNVILTVAAGILFCVPYLLAVFLIGMPFVGTGVLTAISAPGWRFFVGLAIIVFYAALFTLIAMLDSNKARSAVVSLLVSLILFLGGMYVFGTLQEPEYTSRMVLQEDGSFQLQENIPNSNYVRGAVRTIYECVEDSLPSSAAMHIVDRNGEYDWRMAVGLIGWSVVITLCGVTGFKKKDIR